MSNTLYPPSVGPLRPPSKFNTFKEIRAPLEWLFACGNKKKLAHVPCGDQRLVVLVPGYGADEWSMRPLKKFLHSINYRVFDWEHGRNRGRVTADTERLMSTVRKISVANDNAAVTLIGWSLGGVLSREVARIQPELVSEVITMGTPLIGGPKYTVMANKYAQKMSINLDEYEAEIHAINSQGIKQPLTVIYSQSDGIVGWRAAIDNYNQHARNLEVSCSHMGMGVNVEVWKTIAETLALNVTEFRREV